MSISATQIKRKENEVAAACLKRGVVPSAHEVQHDVEAFFNARKPGEPYYTAIPQTVQSNKETYNQMFKNIEEDLAVAHLSNRENSNKLLELQENYAIENARLEARIQSLKMKLDRLTSQSSIYESGTAVTFTDFYQTEFVGDDAKNLPATTGFVDLKQRRVTLEEHQRRATKSDISDASLVHLANNRIQTIGELTEILKNTINETYTFMSTSNTETFVLTLVEPVEANTFLLNLAAQLNISASLIIKDEAGEEELLNEISNRHVFEWSFSTRRIQAVTITLHKAASDGQTEDGRHYYYYALQELSLENRTYASSGLYVSAPISFDRIPSSVTLDVEDIIYGQTNIDYFVGIEQGDTRIEWHPCQNKQKKNLGLTDHVERQLIISTPTPAFTPDYHIYAIHALEDRVIPSSLSLTAFYRKWKMDVIALDPAYTRHLKLESLNLDEAQAHIQQRYTKSAESGSRTLTGSFDAVHILTQYCVLESDTSLMGVKLKATDEHGTPLTTLQSRLFVNGVEIKDVNGVSNLSLKAGVNKVQWLWLCASEPTHLSERVIIKHNLNLERLSQSTYGVKPLRQVPYYQLLNVAESFNTTDNFDYFSVHNGTVMVRHTPDVFLDSTVNALPAYRLQYEKYKQLAYNLGDNVGQCQLRFMAALSSEDPDYSPCLLNYKITI